MYYIVYGISRPPTFRDYRLYNMFPKLEAHHMLDAVVPADYKDRLQSFNVSINTAGLQASLILSRMDCIMQAEQNLITKTMSCNLKPVKLY